MDEQDRRALLVSHEGSRTGAPRMAVEVARGLASAGWHVHAVSRWPGPLDDDLARASHAFSHEPKRRARVTLRRFAATKARAVAIEQRAAERVLARVRPTLVWANTALSACYVRPAMDLGVPVALHVHELEPWTSQVLDRYGLSSVPDGLSLVACSPAVRRELAARFEVDEATVEYLPSTVDVAAVRSAAGGVSEARPPRVVACGTVDHRKGVDLWLDVAEQVLAANDDVVFRWIGGPVPDDIRKRAAAIDPDRVQFPGAVGNPAQEIAAATVFTLPSRADAFPLVVLEAMALQRAIVAFRVGGVDKQLGSAGHLIEPLDTRAFAGAIEALLSGPTDRRVLGGTGRERVNKYFDVRMMRMRAAEIATLHVEGTHTG